MVDRIDDDGRWESSDGVSWLLVEPSQQWLQQREGGTASPFPTDSLASIIDIRDTSRLRSTP